MNDASSRPIDRRARREEARRTRREREQAAAAAALRRKRLTRLGAIIAAIGAIAVLAIVLTGGGGGGSSTTTPAGDNGDAVAGTANLSGIQQRGNVLGDPKAPVRVVEFADMQCPFCKQFAVNALPGIVDTYVRPGRVRMEFATLAFIGPDSTKAAKLVEAASRQNKMWNVLDGLFVSQGAENSGWVTDDLVKRIAAGVPGFDLSRAQSEVDSSAVEKQLADARQLANQFQVQSTPSFLVGRGDSLKVVSADQVETAIKQALQS